MSQPSDVHEQDLEEIVAYLDGELSGEDCARVERRLASDEVYRQELQSVERTWTVLDELPMTMVDDRFSRTTMSMVVEAAAEDVRARTIALPIARRRRRLSTLLAAAAAAALGFLVFRLAWYEPNEALLADLAVIDNVDIYGQFRDAEFLRLLHAELGDELAELGGAADDLDARLKHFAAVASPDVGEVWLRNLSDDDRTNLRAKFNRFRDLPLDEQERLRQLHAEIMAADDAQQLQQTMLAYQQWLGGLSPVQQFDLRIIGAADEQVERIKRLAVEMRDDELLTLSDDELRAFFTALRKPIKDLRDEVTRGDHRIDGRGERDRFGFLLYQAIGRWRRELYEQFDEGKRRDDFYEAVLAALPERSRERFAQLSTQEKVDRFLTWMRQHTTCQGEVTQQELEQFFAEELTAQQRAQLLSLPPGEMEQALRAMYRCPTRRGPEAPLSLGSAQDGRQSEDKDRRDDRRDRD
jgi:hypothetical protein